VNIEYKYTAAVNECIPIRVSDGCIRTLPKRSIGSAETGVDVA
jgi:hypothetical protein